MREFNYSSFSRSIQLLENVDEDNISAQYVDGILKFNLPKPVQKEVKDEKQIQLL